MYYSLVVPAYALCAQAFAQWERPRLVRRVFLPSAATAYSVRHCPALRFALKCVREAALASGLVRH